MIRIPYCLDCDNCKKNMVCDAYPKGIPEEILHTPKTKGTMCNNGVTYKKHIAQNNIKNITDQS